MPTKESETIKKTIKQECIFCKRFCRDTTPKRWKKARQYYCDDCKVQMTIKSY